MMLAPPTTAVVRWSDCCRNWLQSRGEKLRGLHQDEAGAISVLTVITLVMLTMLLGLVINAGLQVDDKVKLQNTVDAAGYSGAVILARGMNSLAFTNHLMSELFAMTAWMREGRDRYAESLVPPILDAWEQVDDLTTLSQFQKIRDITPALAPKIRMEREMVTSFGEMTAVKSAFTLPVLEYILGVPENSTTISSPSQQQAMARTHLIPVFQRAAVRVIPIVALTVTQEITQRHNRGAVRLVRSGQPQTILWRTNVLALGYPNENDPDLRTIPALDPAPEGPDYNYLPTAEAGLYMSEAIRRRNDLARHYLREWIEDRNFDLGPFEREAYSEGGRYSAKMSQFKNLWRGFTCAKLNHLLNIEYPTTNLPHMIRRRRTDTTQQEFLNQQYTFIAMTYRPQRRPTMPGMYRVPMQGDSIAYSQLRIYIPRPRYITGNPCATWYCPSWDWRGQMYCGTPCFDAWPTDWSTFNQNWAAQLTPATHESVATLLQTPPGNYIPNVQLPSLGNVNGQELRRISTH